MFSTLQAWTIVGIASVIWLALSVVGAVNGGPASILALSDLIPLLLRQQVFELGQGGMGSLPVQVAPQVFNQTGAERDCDRLFGCEDQRRHLVATHQRKAAVRSAFGKNGDTHFIQSRKVSVQGAHGDAALFGQGRGRPLGLPGEFRPVANVL